MVNIYELALTKVYGIGPRIAVELMNHIGSAQDLFEMSREDLSVIFRSKEKTIDDILSRRMFPVCEKELEYMTRYNIRSYFICDKDYPERLRNMPDAPVCLFADGEGDLQAKRMVAIVGTREATDYGRYITDNIVAYLKKYNVVVVSGLAYGIDGAAHRACLKYDIPTYAVLAHGLDTIYPGAHFELAQKIKEKGGALISENFTHSVVGSFSFPQRNRIIAGLADLVIVVEAAKKGGALITARLANDYNRDVMAVPGRIGDKKSEGCNFLIESNRANILSSPGSIGKLMMWEEPQTTLPGLLGGESTKDKSETLQGKQKDIYVMLRDRGEMYIDNIANESGINIAEISALLLELELEDYVISKPGKVYKAL